MILDLKNTSFLVVEDIPSMRELLRVMLDSLGVKRIFTAENGKKAVEILYKQNPNIVITDWDMEPIDGIQLTRLIRTDPLSPNRQAPVILATSYTDKEHLTIARDAGVTEYLTKPFSANDLSARLNSVINSPRPFIECPSYIGPCRRRKKNTNYRGPFKRLADWDDPHNIAVTSGKPEPIQVTLSDAPPPLPVSPDSSRSFATSNLRILLVEDNPAVTLVTKMILRNIGITQILVALDGKQALEFLDTAPELIDLIVCDWEMPHVTGIELLRQVRMVAPDVPFIMLTSRTDLQSVRAATDSGVDAYLSKPVSLIDLTINIAKAIQRRKTTNTTSH